MPQFLLTRPSRDVTVLENNGTMANYISTHTSLAGRDQLKTYGLMLNEKISTHTSLAGRDVLIPAPTDAGKNFYSHVPRGT